MTLETKHQADGAKVRNLAVRQVRQEWRRLDPDNLDRSFLGVLERLIQAVTQGQLSNAELSDDYVHKATGVPFRGSVNPEVFSGIASDGRDLSTLLQNPLVTVKQALKAGRPMDRALRQGADEAALMAATEVSDAGRTADGVAITARPSVAGYTRVLSLPSCPRCVILAGKFYKWSDGFARHPGCDCRHVPVTETALPVTTDPAEAVRSGNVEGLSKADRKAIEDGADPSQVINAHRGMSTAADGSRGAGDTSSGAPTKTTTEGTSKHGFSYQRSGGKPRLRPESIYQIAGSRDEAIDLLREYGYIV